MRYFAAISLGRLAIPATLISLQRSRRPIPHACQIAAIEQLAPLARRRDRHSQPLAEHSGDSGVTAIRVLGNAQSNTVVSTLRDAARSPDVARRLAAVEALAKCEWRMLSNRFNGRLRRQ